MRTESVATTAFFLVAGGSLDWQPPIVAGFTPPGTSMQLEFRGRSGASITPWSTSQDVADGMDIQVRVHMNADPVTGAVPWLDTLIVPMQ